MNTRTLITFFTLSCLLLAFSTQAQGDMAQMVSKQAKKINNKVVEWRHHIHQNPELSNREFKTGEYIAAHLKSLGLEVKTGVAKTGVVGILKTGRPGPVVGMRADMDALPVVERVDVPFKSTVKTTYLGNEVGVMHACGHDTHVAMLMGAAEVLTGMKDQLKGTIVFVFQPAEEGAPPGEEGGAKLMVKEGLLKDLGIDVMFGTHINSQTEVGKVTYKPGGAMAAANRYVIKVKGKQTHGSQPWGGIDPITVSAQIIQGLQHIISRQTELTKEAAVISVGRIQGGVRNNIIPEEVEMIGTIRTLNEDMKKDIFEKIERTATNIAEASGAIAEVDIQEGVPVTYNDPELTQQMLPSLHKAAGENNVYLIPAKTGAEDFSYFALEVPSLFVFIGGMPKGMDPSEAAPHHTPDFFIDDSAMETGVKVYSNLAIDYLMK
jgi:amidohydrolase